MSQCWDKKKTKCENRWRAVFEAQPEGELLLPISLSKSSSNYWELCPYTGIPPQVIRRRTVRRQFSALTPGKHFTITSHLQNRSTKSKCRPSTSASLQSPYYFEGTGSSEKELVATHSIIMDLI